MDGYCEIGNCIMELLTEYVGRKNEETFKNLNYATMKSLGKLPGIKANQAELAKLLGKPKSTLSSIIKGETYVSKDLVLELTDKLELESRNFLRLAKLFAVQGNILPLGLIPEHQNKDIVVISKAINDSFVYSVIARLLFEICSTRYEKKMLDYSYWSYSNTTLGTIMKKLQVPNPFNIEEVAKTLLDKK